MLMLNKSRLTLFNVRGCVLAARNLVSFIGYAATQYCTITICNDRGMLQGTEESGNAFATVGMKINERKEGYELD